MATIFSLPLYIPEPTSGEFVSGYEVQSSSVVNSPGLLIPDSSFSDITGSPFFNNTNIVDPSGTVNTWYRAKPVRQIVVGNTTYTLDTSWSKPFQSTTPLFDAIFTRALLPALRFTYLGDQGLAEVNGTTLTDTVGAGNGQWAFDGTTKRFNLQYVMNDDAIRVVDDLYRLVYTPSTGPGAGTEVLMQPNIDYAVDPRSGVIEFATAPAINDYARFEFLHSYFVNNDLLLGLVSGINSLSYYGLNGYQVVNNNNLKTLNQNFKVPDLIELVCKITMLRMREGMTEAAMRSLSAWRDGNASVDPYPSRAAEFLVTKSDINEQHIRREVNTFIRANTLPRGRGEYDCFWDLSQLTPLTSGMFASMPGGSYGTVGAGLGVPAFPFYI